ncbi:MAG: rubredoxin [Calditrichaeota bacterium]|nr:MAG: rubredoxin [Calditrichota bacterium]
MEQYICTNCGYVYDPKEGDPENGIPPGTEFSNLPADWCCPVCYVSKEQFDLLN